jgi:hypothetical protein
MTERQTRKAQTKNSLELRPIGVIRSKLKERSQAPKQGSEGAPDVWLEVHPFAAQALDGVAVGDELVVLTWLHRADRDTFKVRPRSDPNRRLTGVRDTLSRSAKSDRSSSSHGAQNKQATFANRSHRSHRWDACHRYKTRSV